MIKRKRLQNASPAQALVEFALIATVLLMIIFIIIESARILWAWNQVQNAAREGARYAITGQEEIICPVDSMPKFDQRATGGPRYVCGTPGGNRAGSIVFRALESLSGLPLNETSTAFSDDNFFNIEVWGVDESGELTYDFGGLPNQPVVVRVTYQVPIITPLLRPIAKTVPVFGQVTLNNESFGQQTANNQGQGLPPVVPAVPTAGVTPSPTPSPTPTDTPTVGPSPTETEAPTETTTPTATVSICPTRFEGPAIAGSTIIPITGDPGTDFELIDVDTGVTLAYVIDLPAVPGHGCEGFIDFVSNPLSPPLVAGHLILVRNLDDGSFDETFVIGGTPTNTPTATNTPDSTPTASSTPTATPTHTPSSPYVIAIPECSSNSSATFTVAGFNWPTNEALNLFWDTTQFRETINANQHNGFFTRIWTINGLTDGIYVIKVESQNGTVATFDFEVPCDIPLTPTPTTTGLPTATPKPADLIMVSPPQLLSAPPINAYTPLDFSVVITNEGDIDINQQFFVDLYFDSSEIVITDETYLPASDSVGFVAVSGIAAGEVMTLNLRTNRGFENVPDPHQVHGMVDSVGVPGGGQINEPDETNNVSDPLSVPGVIAQNTPTPTPTFDLQGSKLIAGVVQSRIITWVPQQRADVYLYDTTLGQVIARQRTDANGFYLFNNVPDGTYTVYSCLQNTDFFGLRTGIVPSNPVTNIYMQPNQGNSCSLTPPSNNLPAVTNPGDQTNYVGDNVSLTIAATDADGDTLSYSATSLPAGLSINPNTGEITGTLPQGSQGIYSVTVNVFDGQDSSSVFFTWTVYNIKLEAVIENNVNTNWRTVSLSNDYDSMVVVCSVRYSSNTVPIVPRVRNAAGNSFQVRLQNPDGNNPATSRVYCLVVEEGTWQMPDGRKIEAQKIDSTITDRKGSWVGQIASYNQSYTNPVVLGQVMTFNDSNWSVFWSRANSNRQTPPNSGGIQVGKHIAGDNVNTTRLDETIGFIVVEQAHGTVDGVEYEFWLGDDSIGGAGNNGANTDSYSFSTAFNSSPNFGIVSQAAMDGGDGGWAVLKTAGPFTKTIIELAIDEDQIQDNERNHTDEQVSYMVFDSLIVLDGLEN